MTRTAPCALLCVAMVASSCTLTPYPSGVIPCTPDGAACPDGQRCVAVGDAGHRCTNIGCGDGIVDVGIEVVADEQCDDANGNELDLCVDCQLVHYAPDLGRTFGFGVGASVARGTPLGRPIAIGVDLDGNIFVGSTQTNVVSRIAATFGETCSGEEPCPDGSECINARCLAYQVALFGGNGTMVGNAVIAVGDRPNAMSTTFVTSIAVDTFGNVFLGDFQDSVIRRVDAITGLVDTIAGTGIRRASTVTTPTRGTETDLDLPTSLVVDFDGSLLFTETAPGGLSGQRVRRFDPVTGLVSTVPLEGLASTDIDDLTLDDAGNLHALHASVEVDDGGDVDVQRVRVCQFVTSFARVDGALATTGTSRKVCTREEERTRETPPRLIRATGLPQIRKGQAHFATADGHRFYLLMDDHIVELDLTTSDEHATNVIAVVPDPTLEGGGGLIGAGDDGGSALPFAFAPTDLTLHAGTLFVADPGNRLVWRFPVTRRQKANNPVGPDDVVAGELETNQATGAQSLRAPESSDDIINEIALGFAREADGRVGVGASDDCGAENLLDGRAIEFYLAFPDVHRVLFSNCNSAVGILAGTGVAGAAGDGGLAKDAQLHNPTAFLRIERPRADGTIDDAFYIADRNNHRIRRLYLGHIDVAPPQTCVVDADCGVGVVCRKPEAAAPDDPGVCSKPSLLIETFMTEALGVPLVRPSGLAVDDTFALLIADSGNHRVLRHDLETGETTIVFGTGADDGADGGTATTTSLAEPTSLVYLPLALLNTVAELNGNPLPLQLNGGLLVVTERARHRVRGAFVPPIPGFPEVLTLGGDGSAGGDDNKDDGTAGRLHLPRSVMFSIPDVEQQKLTFFVIDAIDRVRELSLSVNLQRFTLQTGLKTREGGGGPSRSDGPRAKATFRSPSALAFLDPAQVLVVDQATGRLRLMTVAADGVVVTVAGMPDGTEPVVHTFSERPEASASALTSAPLRAPTDIALQLDVDPPIAWVTESGRLRRFVLTDVAAPDTWTTDAVEVDGLIRPAALAIEAGQLFIADAGAHAVFRVDTASGDVEVVAGRVGARGDAGDGGPATSALLNAPAGVAVRGDVLLVADTGNNRVRRVDLSPGGSITPFLGDGEPGSGGEGRPASAFPVLAPRGIAIDEVGNVVVAASNVIRFVQAGRPGLATADDDVRTIYGKAPRETFPESATRCLDDVVFAPASPGKRPQVVTVDACVGIVVPLVAR